MSGKLRLNGATSGYSELQAPDVAGDQTFTLPAVGGELATKSGGGQVVGYQQGFWTINVVNSTNNFFAYQPVWSRIGPVVTLNGRFGFSDPDNPSPVEVDGLPYLPNDLTSVITGSAFCQKSKTQQPITAYVGAKPSVLFYPSANAGNYEPTSYNNYTSLAQITFTISYYTDDTTWQPINGATIS